MPSFQKGKNKTKMVYLYMDGCQAQLANGRLLVGASEGEGRTDPGGAAAPTTMAAAADG